MKRHPENNQDFEAIFRQEIERQEWTALGLSEATGIAQPTISRFIHGSGLRLSTASKLAKVLNLKIVRIDKK